MVFVSALSIGLVFAAIFAASVSDAADRLPCTIASGATTRYLDCTRAVTSALSAYDPDFRPYRGDDYLPAIARSFKWSRSLAPFAAVGDFSGDGVPDVVIDGHSRLRRRLIVVESRGDSYKVVEIERDERPYNPKDDRYDDERGRWRFISRIVAPGRARSLGGVRIHLKHAAFELEYWQKASTVFYREGGKWRSYASSD